MARLISTTTALYCRFAAPGENPCVLRLRWRSDDGPGPAAGRRRARPRRNRVLKTVQATCNATAAKPAGELGRRIAQSAIAEFNQFGGHQIDANGRLFHFGLTEAEHEQDEGARQSKLGQLGWWQVMKY